MVTLAPPTTPPDPTPPAISAARRALVDRACERWMHALTDRSRNNNLLYFRDLKTGTLDLTNARPHVLQQLLGGTAVRINQLLPDATNNRPAVQARQILQRARVNQEEKGIDTLFLALGLASWQISDGNRPPAAPTLLLPVTLELISRDGPILAIERGGDAQINQVLLDELARAHGCVIAPETLAADEVETLADIQAFYERLRAAASAVASFSVNERFVLGNFSFMKLAIVQDLRACGDLLAANDVIAALAGAEDARAALHSVREPIDPSDFDRLPPDLEYLVRDADSSQQRVIMAALSGQHCVIQGPPGTGKSQTIANLIAALVAEGKRVLFVAEKRAALEVVLRRLQEVGLGHLALDLHGADITRSAVIRRFAENLDLVRTAVAVDATAIHQPFCNRRWRLNQHVSRLHTARPPSGLSIYAIQGRLLRIPPAAHTVTRWRGEQLKQLTAKTVTGVADALVELGGFVELFRRTSTSPWASVPLKSGHDAQATIELVARLLHELLPSLRTSLREIARTTGLPEPTQLDAVPPTLDLLAEVAAVLADYREELFQTDLPQLAQQLAGAKPSFVHAGVQFVLNREYRDAKTRANQLRRSPVNGIQRGPTLANEIERAAALLQRWRDSGSLAAIPRAYPQLDQARAQFEAVQAALDELATRLDSADLRQRPPDELARILTQLNADSRTAYRVARMHELLAGLQQSGVGALLNELQSSATAPVLWPQQLEHAWLASCLDQILAEDTELAGFNGDAHSRFVTEFRALDEQRLVIAANRVKRAHAERVIAVMNAHPDQEDLVRREAAKRKRHLPLRTLLARAPDVLTTLCPCWMASPLSVSQLIDARQTSFDLVIFDEASQVLPEDAVVALLRGRQVVVAGDRHQLPPSRFFISGDDDDSEEEAAPTEGFESLLDLLSAQLNTWSLDWHYRSRDESLIAFSNQHIYNNRLITFPGANPTGAITHTLVPWVADRDGQDESSSAEIACVIELILQHVSARPHESLGVIAMGIKHAQRIEAALDQALREHPELEPFFSISKIEPFFIKNLERVQGDERDAIILSIGYGKDRSGKLAYRFGPLLTAGGERRLNVAITRARFRLALVSSFSHHDMDPTRSQARGVELLRHYLEYAASGGRYLRADGAASIPLNPFEADVYDALRARGIPLVPQWGVSHYRLDFAAQHPHRPGQFVLAIECDGATYHSAPTARDRDRLRQQHLEALDWRFHRIWSQDWFTQRAQEIERTVRAFERAVRDADGAANGDAAPSAVAPAVTPATPAQQPAPSAPAGVTRGPRPAVMRDQPITHYARTELIALIRWIQSDGRLRTDDEIIDELVRDLGFQRRGPRIVATIRDAIAAAK